MEQAYARWEKIYAACCYFIILHSLRLHLYNSHNPISKLNCNEVAILPHQHFLSWRGLTMFLKQGRMLEDTLTPLAFQTVSKIKRNLLAPHQSSRFNHVEPCFLVVVICILMQVLGSVLSACSCVGNHTQMYINPWSCKLVIQTAGSRVQQEYSWFFVTLLPSKETKVGPWKPKL